MADEFNVSFGSLIRGQLYPISKIEKTESTFYGKKTNGIKVHVLDDELELTTYLPKKLVEIITELDFQRISNAANTDMKDVVCYYGSMVSPQITSFVGRIHQYGEGVNEKLFKDMGLLMKKYGAKRGQDDNDEGVNKKAKMS